MKEYDQAPKLQELTPSQLEICTFMILQQPKQIKTQTQQTNNEATKNTQLNNTNTLHQCATCRKIYNKKQYLTIHRANKPQRKPLWKIENEARKTCPSEKCKEKIQNDSKMPNPHTIPLPPQEH